MNMVKRIEEYADILNLPRPEPKRHFRMERAKRAAQFAPFAALTGYEEVIEKTARIHEQHLEESNREEDEDCWEIRP
ncbi:MAG: hypothetical protein K6F95_01380 [Selenomonas sp.]|uniref:hypothetical protein n=1 Tax=Selenomonas sp. TaxID=2053611 RepID=UPI0025D03046|nr:hypothetical protein [Selenomonas sp.]MCR5756544.1 hypothetical protein [Selenomonas sp.]